MTPPDPQTTLLGYLQTARDALLWKLDGVSEYDVRRPLTPTGTNLLGIVKHVATVEAGYLGECFGRPFPEAMPWVEEDAEDNDDMWATADQSREDIVSLYRRVWKHADATVRELGLEAVGEVPWWQEGKREVTLHQVLVHLIAEAHRHCGHADILRETIDGQVGHRAGVSNLAPGDEAWWAAYVEKVEAAARAAS